MRVWAALTAVTLLALGCAGDDAVPEESGAPSSAPATPVDDTGTAPSSSSSTTSTVPVSERLPPLAADATGAVVTPQGAALAITGTDGESWLVLDTCGAPGSVSAPSATVVGPQHVVLDPGNGGEDRGTVGPGGVDEAEVNLDVARRAADVLRGHGVAVLLTRDGDVGMTASARAAVADAVGAQVFLSIQHRDGPGDRSTVPGTESFHRIDDPDSRRLAGLVFEEVQAGLGPRAAGWLAPAEPGVKPLLNQRGEDFHTVLRETVGVAAAFVEVAVLAGGAEAALLSSEEGRQAEAEALASAVIRYLVTAEEGRGFVEPTERVRPAEPLTPPADCS